ncbi:MAG: hypothetical protein H6862_00750 [Rhodospirillales bacterium]|nr:hypothetical protein [Rhodospirillales bacterium]
MSGNPPHLTPAFEAQIARKGVNLALEHLAERKTAWDGVRTGWTARRDSLQAYRDEVERLLYKNDDVPVTKGRRFADEAKRVLTLGKVRRTALDSDIRDLHVVEDILKNSVPPALARKAQALGLPTDPVALYQKKIELTESLNDFSGLMALDSLTRNSRRMRSYIKALESGNYTKAIRLANKEPPLLVRCQFWAPWKAQAMRNDRAALLAGIDTYRRTKESIKAAEKLSNKIETSTANAIRKALHSDAWGRLHTRKDVIGALAGNPALAILTKYSPAENKEQGLIRRMFAGKPTKTEIMADLLDARMTGVAGGKRPPSGLDMARPLADLAKQYEAARTTLKQQNKALGVELAKCNRILKYNARQEKAEISKIESETDALKKAHKAVGRAAMEGSPEDRERYRANRAALFAFEKATSKAEKQTIPAGRRKRIEDAAIAAAEGKPIPKNTPGLSPLRQAFSEAASGIMEATPVRLSQVWNFLKNITTKTEPVHKERIEPVFA